MHPYRPEGSFTEVPSPELLRKYAGTDKVFQAACTKCDEHLNLHVDLGNLKGIIPRDETTLGLTEGRVKEIAIVSRVGKPVCFQVLSFDHRGTVILSRKAAQAEAKNYFFSVLHPGDIISARVQNTSPLGVFCDIGCGFTALMRISRCCVSRLKDASALFHPGQELLTAVYQIDDDRGHIELTGRELLGTWEENASLFRPGQTVTGTVRSIMPYGMFIELTPNLSGLAEPKEGLSPGDRVSVYIRSIQPQQHKIKLSLLEVLPPAVVPPRLQYFIESGSLKQWEYYPGSKAVTVF